jgi:phosphoacetylglucosamine mutase
MLHHVVLHANPQYLPLLIPPRPNLQGYYDLLAHSYNALLLTGTPLQQQQESLVVDCACGVGYAPVQRLNDMLQQLYPRCRKIVARNAPGGGPLNEGCGSEHVQKEVCPPKWYGNNHAPSHYTASLDGDADRIVFFFLQNHPTLHFWMVTRLPCSFVTFFKNKCQCYKELCKKRARRCHR